MPRLRQAVRRPQRDDLRRPSSAIAGLGPLPLLHGLNLSNEQIAQELGIDPDDAQVMASQLREGIVQRQPEVVLFGEVECDEVYVVAGHKGQHEAVEKKVGLPDGDV